MAKLFVSYSRKDSAAARKLIEALASIEQDPWVDWEDIPPAVDWLEQIFRGIEASDAFLFLISPDSIASEVCNVEVKHAAKNNKRIIPILLRDVDTKSTSEIIRKLNWTYMREEDNFEEALTKVKVAIELDLPWLEEHNRLQARALDWERRKEPSLLLSGRALRNARNMIAAATSKDPTPTELQKTYIQHSTRRERTRIGAMIAAGIALLIMAFLTVAADRAEELARQHERTAVANEAFAKTEQARAEDEERIALTAQAIAEAQSTIAAEQRHIANEQRKIAEAQRSAARAQIFQTERELYVSTLLAIDALLKSPDSPSPEAEEILRKNLSLLPIPVAQAGQSGKINSLEFSPDGNTFVTASADFKACLWKLEDGQEIFCVPSASDTSVNDAAFSPDGRILVMGDDSGLVQIVNAESGAVENSFDYDAAVRDISIQPDGELLTAATSNGKIHIIVLTAEADERREISTLQTANPLNVSAISPNGRWLAAGSTTGSVTVWDLNDLRKPPGSYPIHKGEILALSFNPQSNFIVTGSRDRTASAVLTSTGRVVLPVINEDSVQDVAFSPDSSWFVTVSNDNRIRVWDMESGTERLRMLQDGVVTEVEISPNGQWIATTGDDRTVRLWNAATGAEILQIPLRAGGSVLAFSADGNHLVSGDQIGAINVWDIAEMTVPASYVSLNGLAGNVTYSPSGTLIVASDARYIWRLTPESVSNQRLAPEDAERMNFRSDLKDVIVSPDSRWLGALTQGSQVNVYRIQDRTVKGLRIPTNIRAIAFSPDSLALITGDVNGKVQAWNVNDTGFIKDLLEEESGVLALAAQGNLLAVGLKDSIAILDITTEQELPGIQAPGDHSLLAFSADGSLLASGNSSGQINVWKSQDGQFSAAGSFTKEQAVSLALNPQGTVLAIGTASYVYLIDLTTGEEVGRIPHRDSVRDLAFSPDGSSLATASSSAIQFWDVEKLQRQQIEKDDLIATACARIPKNFSDAQWGSLLSLCEN
ncbi:MAG TPA: TIR domain-containing protein [Anaerolineales bacterium]|nr:TIR domain-containing protein [Anaerolineales bacterium]